MFKLSLLPFMLEGYWGSSSKKMVKGRQEEQKNNCSFFSHFKPFQKRQVLEQISDGMEEAPESTFSKPFQVLHQVLTPKVLM